MLTEAQRRRLAEFEGRKWLSRFEEDECEVCGSPYNVNPNYSDWNSVCRLLAKIVERGEWEAFYQWLYDEKWTAGHFDLYLFANFTNPSHTAGLVDQAIVAQVLYIVRDGKKLYWFEDGWRERA